MNIKKNIEFLQTEAGDNVTLVAVSKTKPNSDILEAYNAGQRHFGENKVQELCEKAEILPKDIKWHMIGHLQRNKVKYIAPFVSLIHSVDSPRLLEEINNQGAKINRVIDCLFQVHIAEEESKFGWDIPELLSFLESDVMRSMENIQIKGLMGMATFTEDHEKISREFSSLKQLFDRLSNSEYPRLSCEILSMGMSGDYKIALKQGSNMIRVGSSIFGTRNYNQ